MIGHTDSRKASIAVIIGAIGLVCFSMAKPVSDAGCIVFARDGCIWVMSADGGSEKQLTFGGKDGTPAWSPDGEQIAFYRSIDDTSLGDIYVMNADGANLKQVTSGPEHDNSPAWSPNGRQIAFSRQVWEKIREGEWEQRSAAIYVMDADGSDVRRLTVEDPFFFSWSVDWSSDGAMIVFHQYNSRTGNRIWVMNADGSSQKLLLEWGDDPAWSPDGSKIALSSTEARERVWESYEIYVMDADGSNVRKLTGADLSGEGEPDWSPDGMKIAFSAVQDDNYDIYVMNADGSNVQRLTNTPEHEWWPDWAASSYAVEPAGKARGTWGWIKRKSH